MTLSQHALGRGSGKSKDKAASRATETLLWAREIGDGQTAPRRQEEGPAARLVRPSRRAAAGREPRPRRWAEEPPEHEERSPDGLSARRRSCWQYLPFGSSNPHCGSRGPGPSNFAKLTIQAEIFHACSRRWAGIFRSFSRSNSDISKK